VTVVKPEVLPDDDVTVDVTAAVVIEETEVVDETEEEEAVVVCATLEDVDDILVAATEDVDKTASEVLLDDAAMALLELLDPETV